MYNSTSIQVLVDRIGWAQAVAPNTAITIDANNLKSDSGRLYNSFHKMAIVENVKESQPNSEITNTNLNIYLYDMKGAAVRKVLSLVFDKNERAYFKFNPKGERVTNSISDYSDIIIAKASLFDDAVGYQVACDVLELMSISTRTNTTQQNAKASFLELKYELDGAVNENGHVVSKGTYAKLNDSVEGIIEILFPKNTNSKRTIRGVSVW